MNEPVVTIVETAIPSPARTHRQRSPVRSRADLLGSLPAEGELDQQLGIELDEYAKLLVQGWTRHDVGEALQIPSSAEAEATESACLAISCNVEQLIAGRRLSNAAERRIADLLAWQGGGDGMGSEKPVYQYFTHFVEMVQLLHRAHAKRGQRKRPVLPMAETDFKPGDSNDARRVDMGLVDTGSPKDVDRVTTRNYCDMFCVIEAKWRLSEYENALQQLFVYSISVLRRQPHRRYLWGLIICASHVYACLMLLDGAIVSPAMSMGTAEGRLALIRLLVNWLTCPPERLGADVEMRRQHRHRSQSHSGSGGYTDDNHYEVAFTDDATKASKTLVTMRTVVATDDLFGERTRLYVCDVCNPAPTEGHYNQVLLKDTWQLVQSSDRPSEVSLLREINERFRETEQRFPYPKVVGYRNLMVTEDGTTWLDNSDTILKLRGFTRLDPPTNPEEKCTWRHQPLRQHCQLLMEPVGHYIRTVTCEEELIIVLADAMRFHRAVYEECGILHRHISPNSILVVRKKGDPYPHGLLINFENAIKTDAGELPTRMERSGSQLFRSIADLLDLDVEQTVLDDWESLLYVICWLATVGIREEDRIRGIKEMKCGIFQWRNGANETLARVKRTHMDIISSFKTNIVSQFQRKYPLLAYLAVKLHTAMFRYKDCPGALGPVKLAFEGCPGLPDILPKLDEPEEDPLVKRVQFEKDIVTRLWTAMDAVDKFAKERLGQKQGSSSTSST
ncbi:hypothetical protein GGF46_000339 [Coemansia sp. RSA 552]|nr:hypothetical protein GGF46_000339 [Coemansia sp. RSA 552]